MQDAGEPVALAAEETLARWLKALRVGAPLAHGGLALVPVYAESPTPRLAYRTLAEAIATGEVTITEQPQATVPTLQVVNQGPLPVLILEGEEVVGGRQNRVVNTTLLVPAACAFDLPVTCVEHGRWHETGRTFESGETAYPTLRSQKMAQVAAAYDSGAPPMADQAAVWDEVARRHRADRVRSGTGAMADSYRQHHFNLQEAEQKLLCPPDGPVGVVALVGGRARCADIFDRPATLQAYWPRLVRSYALEAIGVQPAEPAVDSAERLLRRPLAAARTAFPSPGLGADVRVAGNGVVGAALVYEGLAIHAALFRQRGRRAEPTIRRPSERAQHHTR